MTRLSMWDRFFTPAVGLPMSSDLTGCCARIAAALSRKKVLLCSLTVGLFGF